MTHATTALRHGVMAQDAYAQRVLAFGDNGYPMYAPGAGTASPAVAGPGSAAPVAAAAPLGAVAAPGWPGSPASAGPSTSEQIDHLAGLHAYGVLTDDEYHAAVKRVLDV